VLNPAPSLPIDGSVDATRDDRAACPDCHVELARVVSARGLRYSCVGCGGVAVGLSVLRRTLAEGLATELWMASAAVPEAGTPCPFCDRALRPTPARDAVVGVCRPCEVMWLDTAAQSRLPGVSAPSAGERLMPERCPNCGAPWAPAPDGSCRWCHAVAERAVAGYPASVARTTAGYTSDGSAVARFRSS